MPAAKHPDLIVGLNTSDDAAVYKLNESTAIISTVDFFTPVIDDPYLFGQIAAANSLSDVYAMGGHPLLALNLVCYPACLPLDTLREILRGGADKVAEAGAVIAGGHTVEDEEPKYGLAVTGLVSASQVITNSKARAGDYLVLTKPLGTGIITTAIKGNLAGGEAVQQAVASMKELNAMAAKAMVDNGANACTDITGFGLLGHAAELAEASGVSLEIWSDTIPLLYDVISLAAMGIIPAGAYRNKDYLAGKINFAPGIKRELEISLYDPQTSGGLLITIPEARLQNLVNAMQEAGVKNYGIVGKVTKRENYLIKVI